MSNIATVKFFRGTGPNDWAVFKDLSPELRSKPYLEEGEAEPTNWGLTHQNAARIADRENVLAARQMKAEKVDEGMEVLRLELMGEQNLVVAHQIHQFRQALSEASKARLYDIFQSNK